MSAAPPVLEWWKKSPQTPQPGLLSPSDHQQVQNVSMPPGCIHPAQRLEPTCPYQMFISLSRMKAQARKNKLALVRGGSMRRAVARRNRLDLEASVRCSHLSGRRESNQRPVNSPTPNQRQTISQCTRSEVLAPKLSTALRILCELRPQRRTRLSWVAVPCCLFLLSCMDCDCFDR
jgi:hypothetical protein